MKNNYKPQTVPSLTGMKRTRLTAFDGVLIDLMADTAPKDAVAKLRTAKNGSLDRVATHVENLRDTIGGEASSAYITHRGKKINPEHVFFWCDRLLNHTLTEIDAKSIHTTIMSSILLDPTESLNLLLRATMGNGTRKAAEAFDKLEKTIPFIITEMKLNAKKFFSTTPTPSDVLARCSVLLGHLKKSKTPVVEMLLEEERNGKSVSLSEMLRYLEDNGIMFSPIGENIEIDKVLRVEGNIHTVVDGKSLSVPVVLENGLFTHYTLCISSADTHEAHAFIRTLAKKLEHTPLIYRNYEKNPVELVTSISLFPHNPNEAGALGSTTTQVKVPLHKLNGHQIDGTSPDRLRKLSQQAAEDSETDQDQ